MKPILTAQVGDNGDLFKDAFSLFVKPDTDVLDMTYGKGVFWKLIDTSLFRLVKNDLDPTRGDVHEDFRETSFLDSEFDCVVLDPPYASISSSKKGVSGEMYNNNLHNLNSIKDLNEFYYDGIKEAHRVLKNNGILFVKCMDGISGGKQHRTHFEVWKYALSFNMIDEDLFVLVQDHDPIMRHDHQIHARKNNSFLWVFRKK